jgi:hypothetical protein
MAADLITRPRSDATSRSSGSLLRSLEGMVISVTAASQEALQVSKEIQVSAERTAKMLGSVLDRAEVIIGRSAGSKGSVGASTGSGIVARTGLGGTEDVGGGSTDVVRTGIGPGVPGGVPEGGGEKPRPSFIPEGWGEGKSTSLTDLRSAAASRAAEGMSGWGTSQKQVFRNELGQYDSRLVPRGSPRFRDDFIGQGPGWRATAVSGAKQAVASLGEGASFGQAFGSMGMGAAKVAGVAGMAYTGINWGLNTAEAQRAKNAEYQAMIGGTNTSQFGERFDETRFRWSMRGTMSGGDATAIYKGAAAQYGSNQSARGEFQDAAISMYRNSGLGATESLALLNMSVNSGNDSLTMLADSIRRLGTEAKKAGVSAKVAREYFTQSFQSIGGVANGGVQVTAAEIEAKTRMAMGRQYGASIDTSAQDSRLGTMIGARAAGISRSEFMAATMYGQTVNSPVYGKVDGAMLLAETDNYYAEKGMASIDSGGELRRFLTQRAQQEGWSKTNQPNQDQLDDLAGEMSVKFPSLADPMRMADLFRVAGLTGIPEGEAAGLFVQKVLNLGSSELEQLKDDRASQRTPQRFKVNPSPSGTRGTIPTTGWDPLSKGKPGSLKGDYKKAYDFITDGLGLKMGSARANPTAWNWRKDGRSGLQNALAQQAVMGKDVNPAMLKLFQGWDSLGSEDARLIVETEDGKKSVEMGEAAALFGDQIRARPQDIKIQGGTMDGQNIADAFGIIATGPNQGKSLSEFASAQDNGDVGISVEDGRDRVKDSSSSGKVEVWIRPEFAHILGVTATGSAYTNNSRAPANSDRTPETQGS